MNRLHIGFQNKSLKPDAREKYYREKLYFTEENSDFLTHIHGVGATRSGKSKWLEYVCRGLIRAGVGFTLIDPQGKLSEDLMAYAAYSLPAHIKILYFNPSRDDYLIPFNPFFGGQDDISVRVDRYVTSTLKVWGVENEDETPRLGRWLRNVYFLFALGEITFNEVDTLLRFTKAGKALRAKIIAHIEAEYPEVAAELEELQGMKRSSDFLNQIESVRNRLIRFSSPPQIRRLMSLRDGNLDFRDIFAEGSIVIANLQDSPKFSEQNARVIGTLMINELWSAAKRYSNKPHDYFLFVDEVENFLTPDLKEILDRGAGKGLHLGVFHQHLTQLQAKDRWTYDSVMGNAKIKVVFGGLTKENALIMVDELFPGQLQYDEVKFYLKQTKFWPKYRRDKIYSRSRSRATSTSSGSGRSYGSGSSSGSGSSIGTGMGSARAERYLPDDDLEMLGYAVTQSASEMMSDSRFSGESSFEGYSSSESQSDTEGWTEGEADVPIFYPEPFQEVSSVELFSIEEQKQRAADKLQLAPQRHYFIRRPGKDTVPAVTPFVKEYYIDPELMEANIMQYFVKPYAMAVGEIDKQLKEQKKLLLADENQQEVLEDPDDEVTPWE